MQKQFLLSWIRKDEVEDQSLRSPARKKAVAVAEAEADVKVADVAKVVSEEKVEVVKEEAVKAADVAKVVAEKAALPNPEEELEVN